MATQGFSDSGVTMRSCGQIASRRAKRLRLPGSSAYACRRPAWDGRMTVAARETSSFAATLAALRRETAHNPRRPQIWRQLADHLDTAGDRAGAETAYL